MMVYNTSKPRSWNSGAFFDVIKRELIFIDAVPYGLNRIVLVTGHYGSGKTEFSVSLAAKTASDKTDFKKLAVIDLDIANPYFRSRERRDMLERLGVSVYGSAYSTEITAELPALGAGLRTPLEDKETRVIVDAGGNDSGALVLNQFKKYFTPSQTSVLAVVNANRPETQTVEGAIDHIRAIERATELTVTGIVNNTHLLRETTADTILQGYKLCREICQMLPARIVCNCYPEDVVNSAELCGVPDLFELGLFLRPTWLDR